jgi:hypothetical protein
VKYFSFQDPPPKMKIGHFKNVQKRGFLLAFPKKIKNSLVTEKVTNPK